MYGQFGNLRVKDCLNGCGLQGQEQPMEVEGVGLLNFGVCSHDRQN